MKIFIAAVLVSAANFAFGQAAIPQNMRATNTLEGLVRITPNELLYGIPLPEKELIGDAYLNQQWKNSRLLLYNKETVFEGYPARYDLLKQEMEISSKSGVKVIDGKRIKSFILVDSLSNTPNFYVNAQDYKDEEGNSLSGFFQVIADGSLPLLKHTVASIKKANYTMQFDVGSRDDKIIKNHTLYYASRGVVYETPRSKKKLLVIFGDKSKTVNGFIKKNMLVLNDDDHVKKIFEYYNSLH